MHPRPSSLAIASILRLARAMDGVGESATASPYRRQNPPDDPHEPATLMISRHADEASVMIILRQQTTRKVRTVGVLSARLSEQHQCGAALSEVSRRIGLRRDAKPFVVVQSELDFSLRGRGIGAWLYAEAARVARGAGAVLLADNCESPGNTSERARRVWASQRIHPYVEVVGEVMGWRDPEGPPMPTPPGVSILAARSNPSATVTLYALSRRDESGLTVALYARPNDRYTDHIGLLRAQRLADDERLESTCASAVRSLASAAGVKPSAPYVVLESDLLDDFHGRGIGAWMYAEAVRLAWVQDRAALVADICTGDGVTSLSAGRVWDGAALRLVAHVEDRAAIWRGARRAVPAPAEVRMRSYRMSS